MAYVSPFEDAPVADAGQLKEASGANDNVLSRSLRGGLYGAGSQLLSTGAAVADAVGADEVGAGLHSRSKSLRDVGALPGNAPRVGSYDQLKNNFSMDNLGEYVGGLVGGSLPVTAAGIAGGIATGGAGFIPAMLGAGAATMPFNVGEVVQRQQADPQALQQGAGQRLGEAVLGGAGASAVESLVPGLVGRQILGKGMSNLGKESVKQIVGRNAMDIPLEGLTEGAGTAVKQFAANQDKPLDWNEIKEGAIGGAAAGSVFTGVGTAADLAHSVGPKAGEAFDGARTSIRDRLNAAKQTVGEKVDAAAETAPGKKVKGVFDDVADMVDRGKQKFDDTLDKIMKGEELGSPGDWLKATTDDAKKYMTDFSDSEKVKAVTKAAKEMMDDAGLDEAKRADLADAMKNTSDRASQMTVATMKKAWDLSKKAGSRIQELADAFGEGYKSYQRSDVDAESRTVDEENDALNNFDRLGHTPPSAKADAPAGEAPAAAKKPSDMTIKEFSAARKAFIAKAITENPELSEVEARAMFNTSQNDGRAGMPPPPDVPKMSEDYTGFHKVIADAIRENGIADRSPELFDTPEKTQTVARTLRVMMGRMAEGEVSPALLKKITRVFGDEALSMLNTVKRVSGDLTPEGSKQFFRNLKVMKEIETQERSLHDVMRQSMTDEARTRRQDVEVDSDILIKHAQGMMGKGSPDEVAIADMEINDYYERNYGENADAVRAAVEKAAKTQRGKDAGADRLDENGAVVEGEHYSEGGFDENGQRLEAGSRDMQVFGLSKPNKNDQSKSQLNGRAMHKDDRYVKQHIADLRRVPEPGEKPNPYAEVDSNGDYVYDVSFKQMPGSEFGHIVVEKYDNSKEFNETDLKKMLLETHEHSESKSRIEVGEHILDAVKIAKVVRGKLQDQFESGATTAKGRMAEGFKHGLSLLMAQYGESINPANTTVIGYISGKPFTWGEAQKLTKATHADKMNDMEAQELTELRKGYQDAVNAGASPEVIKEYRDEMRALQAKIASRAEEELSKGEDYQSSGGRGIGFSVLPQYRTARQKAPTVVRPSDSAEVTKAPKVEVDEETGVNRVVRPANINGESKDESNGSTAKDKDGNIHAMGDHSKPLFGGNDKNRVTRKPWGAVDEQGDAQPTLDAKGIKNKQMDLASKDENIHRSNMDGSGHFVSPKTLPHNNLVMAIGEWDGEASAGAAKLKSRAQTLLANIGVMSTPDQRRFTSIAPESVRGGRTSVLSAADAAKVKTLKSGNRVLRSLSSTGSLAVSWESAEDGNADWGQERRVLVHYSNGETSEEFISSELPSSFAPNSSAAKAALEKMGRLKPVTFKPMTMVEARDIVNELATKYKDQIVAPGKTATSITGVKGTVHQRNPVQFYNDGKAATGKIRRPDGAAQVAQVAQPAAQPAAAAAAAPAAQAAPAIMNRAINQRRNYLDNPPDDYSADKVKGILDWAAKQKERIDAELEKIDGGDDTVREDQLGDWGKDLNLIIADAKAMLQNEKDMAAADKANGTNLFGGNPDPTDSKSRKVNREPSAPPPNRQETIEHLGRTLKVIDTKAQYLQSIVDKFDEKTPRDFVFEIRERQNENNKLKKEKAAELANLFGGNPDPKPVAAKKAAFLERAASGDKALIDELKASTDAKGLQRALDLLNDHEFEGVGQNDKAADNVVDMYDVINARLAELVQDPDVAYGLQTPKYSLESAQSTNPNKSSGPRRRASIEQHIEKVLGKSVRVLWQNFSHAGQYTHAFGKGLIELSVHALNPMSTAYHESLHAFFAQLRDAGATDITNVLKTAASSEHVMAQLTERFKNEPAVLAQLKDPEERAAYMYQMWASDPTFKVSIAAKNVFQKIAALIRKTLGIWSNDERALHIMEYFNSGEYAKAMGTPNAVRRALMEPGTNRAVETAKTFTEPLANLADALLSSGDARLRDTNIAALVELADKIKRPNTQAGRDQGFIPAARIQTTKRLGAMAEALEGYTPEQLNDALEALQTGRAATSPEGRLAVRAVKDILGRTKAYMENSGVKLGDLGPDYFPRVWDTHYISQNEQAMQTMLQPYVRSGQFKGNTTEFIRRLTSREGNEFGIVSRAPGMQHTKNRDLSFLKAEDVAPFLNKDLMGTLASYIGQAARRAEWQKRLGDGKLEALMLEAEGQGATKEQLVTAENYLQAVDGTLGDDINPNARRLMGNMIVYQNVRLLPMAMFSMLVDPMGVMVRGGSVVDAFDTFKRGMKSIPVTYGKKEVKDSAVQMAELVGVVDNAVLTSVMGDIYTQGMVGGTAKKINNAFFKYNMVEGLNRSFRVGATQAAVKFMARHADGTASDHSTRWMAELGLQAGDVKDVGGGNIALTQAAGLSRAQEQRVHAAINQWVDGAMLRPDAADKPIWMSDPHYALISHLKQFVFSFQKIILGRMVHEFKNGNFAPAMVLASYVPMMIAADAAKGVIQGGGDTPVWKKGWGVSDYVGYGVERAGLLGVGQFGADIVQDVNRGGSGFGALSGPTLEQLADAVQLMGGNKQFGPLLLDAMPANALYKESVGGSPDVVADAPGVRE